MWREEKAQRTRPVLGVTLWGVEGGPGPWPQDALGCSCCRHLLSLFSLHPLRVFLFFPCEEAKIWVFVDTRLGIGTPLTLIQCIPASDVSACIFHVFGGLRHGQVGSQRWPSASVAVFLLGSNVSFEDVEEILFPATQMRIELGFGSHTTGTMTFCPTVNL